jgi:hypothetical protein
MKVRNPDITDACHHFEIGANISKTFPALNRIGRLDKDQSLVSQ